jgi:spore coat polysaccharide biosynthesis protein SpsF
MILARLERDSMKIVATIEARMSSSRLPGKVLLPAMGRPLLGHLVRRLRAVPSLNEIVLATTVNDADDVLASFARECGINCFRGSEDDVMGRVAGAAASAGGDLVVETTGDNPLIDPNIVETVIRTFLANDADYVSNTHVRSFPDGMDVQVFRLETLERSASMTDAPLDREHVTLHIRKHPELFRSIHIVAPPDQHWPELGLTLDEHRDYKLIRRVVECLEPVDPLFKCADIVRLLRNNPSWLELNRAVVRKGDS